MIKTTVKNLMQTNPLSIQCKTPLSEVLNKLVVAKTSGLPVVNTHNEVIGFVSGYDCHKALLASSYFCDKPIIVNDIMSKSVPTLDPNDGLEDAAIRVLDKTIDVYPVVENKQLIGTLTRNDLLSILNANLGLCRTSHG
jgi:CBS domain-containing protein